MAEQYRILRAMFSVRLQIGKKTVNFGKPLREYLKPGGGHNDRMRHCTAMCTLKKEKGSLCAWAAGWWNELRPGRSGRAGMLEDARSNRIGRGCSDDTGDGCDAIYSSCESCCSDSL